MPVTPLSPLHGQLDRNYGQAAARILLARLSSRLRLQTAHRAVCFTAQPIRGGLTRTISRRQIGDRGGCNGRWNAIARHGRSPGRVRARSRARRRRPPTAGSWRCAVRRKYGSPSRNRERPDCTDGRQSSSQSHGRRKSCHRALRERWRRRRRRFQHGHHS